MADKPFKIDLLLSPSERDHFERLALDKGTTIRSLQLQLQEYGHTVGHSATHRWRAHIRRDSTDPILLLRARLHHMISQASSEQLSRLAYFIEAAATN